MIPGTADANGGLLVTTTEGSGKVKRLRQDRRVQLRPCDRRGAVNPDAPVLCAQAGIVDAEEEVRRLRESIRSSEVRLADEDHRGRSGNLGPGGTRPGHP